MRAKLRLTVVGCVLASIAWPSAANGQAPIEDFAVGDVVQLPTRPVTFVFNARSGPSGENPSGTVEWADRVQLYGGPVTCLTVTGNRATIGFENQHDLSEDFKGGLIFLEDNGTPGVGKDLIVGDGLLADPPTVCPPNTVIYNFLQTVTSGELIVNDAPALPTSKNQCKNGGWGNYGTAFTNQGQCVAFVVRRGCRVQRGTITYRDPYCANPVRTPHG
jgi:hypothetical protein